MRVTKQDLIDMIIATHIDWSEKLDAGYDEEHEEIDREYLGELRPCELEEELDMARTGAQFDE